ncbi:alpha/beta family hydrolase [Vibrio rumoiensis]|uniref:Alpha/beta hydrolase n=1 Tax=Vibrio rumoiensis 1S-45 TaxID=1188252 RepID=A0A1E5E0D5_9VIBR|nr:alpha/beta family hydrolase [Vibrio rumoiensis]OEF23924.1 alpha/beta hydrolase [Vibrio rumoiensis 1S-45]
MSVDVNSSSVLIDGAQHAKVTILLAHGAGAGMDHEFMADIAKQLASHDIRVIRFNFPYMIKRAEDGKKRPPDRAPKLLADFEEKIAQYHQDSEYLFLAGKSMGGRMASHLAEHELVTGVMCLGFPFHPPGKPENYKGEHLSHLTKPTLILQGERDTFGTKQECADFVFSDSISIDFIPDGDHSFKPRVRSGHTELANRTLAVNKMVEFIQQHIK